MMSILFYCSFFFMFLFMGFGSYSFFSLFLFLMFFILINLNMFVFLDFGLVDYFFYLDFYSFFMILLTFWCFSLIFLMVSSSSVLLLVIYFFLFFSLVFSFLSSSIYFYYIFFEFSMIPIFILILYKGSGFDRLLSCYYMLIYTLLSSLPSLFILFSLYNYYGIILYGLFNLLGYSVSLFIGAFLILMFLFKVPIFIFHIWLPKAHVDAPVEGSMILASIMLKLGGYGIYRLMFMFNLDLFILYSVFSISMIGGFLLSIFSVFIFDSKVLIAYSSVIHMCMMICSLFSFSLIGWCGSFLTMISHGVCSCCLFMMSNMIYLRLNSRCMIFNKGFFNINPVFSYYYFCFIFFNIGAPPSLSLFSEIFMIIGLLSVDWILGIIIFLVIFFISCSMVNLYLSLYLSGFNMIMVPFFVNEYFYIFYHIIPLFSFVFFIYMFF